MREWIAIISRIIIAGVFIFSGFVKCVDPSGFAIKLEEYFVAMNIDFMIPFALVLSVLACGAEMLVGIMLLLNLKIKLAIWMSVALMVFFTPLTLWLAVTNKVTDCGCFGDAIVLTNWETFLKNVVIDVFIVILVLNRNRYKNRLKQRFQLIAAGGAALLVLGFELYNLTHLPVIDFMPYKIGASIPEGMVVPEGTPRDSFNVVLQYTKDGVVKDFDLNNYPHNDTTWKFVDSKSIPVRVTLPLIHDFFIFTAEGDDMTDLILSDPGYSLLVIFHSLKKATLVNLEEINRLVEQAITKGYHVYGVTSSVPEEFEAFMEKAKATYPMYNMDDTTLKTMIRSNPGLMLIKGGVIQGKWHHRRLKNLKEI